MYTYAEQNDLHSGLFTQSMFFFCEAGKAVKRPNEKPFYAHTYVHTHVYT
jgi:hypothetical protein